MCTRRSPHYTPLNPGAAAVDRYVAQREAMILSEPSKCWYAPFAVDTLSTRPPPPPRASWRPPAPSVDQRDSSGTDRTTVTLDPYV